MIACRFLHHKSLIIDYNQFHYIILQLYGLYGFRWSSQIRWRWWPWWLTQCQVPSDKKSHEWGIVRYKMATCPKDSIFSLGRIDSLTWIQTIRLTWTYQSLHLHLPTHTQVCTYYLLDGDLPTSHLPAPHSNSSPAPVDQSEEEISFSWMLFEVKTWLWWFQYVWWSFN